jgi:hypothetical protein
MRAIISLTEPHSVLRGYEPAKIHLGGEFSAACGFLLGFFKQNPMKINSILKGDNLMETLNQNTSVTRENATPMTFRKRIGSTNYIVSVYFSETSKETFEDKVLRLIKLDAARLA